MDNLPDSILRPSAQFPNHIHSLGYRRTSISRASWRFYFQTFWKEMVPERDVVSGADVFLTFVATQDATERQTPLVFVGGP